MNSWPTLQSINPSTGEVIATYSEHSPSDVDGFLLEMDFAQRRWRKTGLAERVAVLQSLASLFRRDLDTLARLMAMEMGKPLTQGRAEIEKCAGCCEFFAEHAGQFLAAKEVRTEALRSYVVFEPLGILLAIMPWNFPFWQAIRAAVPALAAGNAILLKHASNVCGCALELERLFKDAGLPGGLFRTALVPSKRVGELVAHPLVRAVTMTGSTPAGRIVASQAGAALKKTVLELGGSDPYLILEDANLDDAAEICAASRLINSGQSCIAAKRFIVVESVLADFTERLVERMAARKLGEPMEHGVEIGPLARADLRESLHGQVKRSLSQGAKLLLGGEVKSKTGAFYPATVLADVTPGMPVFDEETFGPVAAVIGVQDEGEAIELANRSCFGLGAAVFTRDLERGERIAREGIEAGSCFVNDFVRSDSRLPFGGIKDSGFGRELSAFGMREFMNVKTIVVR